MLMLPYDSVTIYNVSIKTTLALCSVADCQNLLNGVGRVSCAFMHNLKEGTFKSFFFVGFTLHQHTVDVI